ncbi:SDR family NAD(P)-dependent oxidoreductase [bacterium]|nr:SDR family NAD(P)-dependent oxidoreductase [bacterium]
MKKVIVLTGSTSGIGNALLKETVKDNIVFAGYRNEKYVEELEKLGAIPFYIDMGKPSSVAQASAFIKSKTDNIDILINVAGCVIAGLMENLPVEDVRKQFEVNTFSHLDFTQKLLPILKDKIINISSMASFGIFPFVAPYCASKRALDILFNGMSLESGIKVVSVKPGVIATPLWDKSIEINKSAIKNCKNHEKEMNFLVANARKNGKNGLETTKVVKLISKIINLKNPKPSYTIGLDAKTAELFSKLPFGLQNKIIRLGMKMRIQ